MGLACSFLSFSLGFFFFSNKKTPIPKKMKADLLHQLVRLMPSVVKLFAEGFPRF